MTDAADTQENCALGHIALDYSERAAACGPKDCGWPSGTRRNQRLEKCSPSSHERTGLRFSRIKASVDKALAIDPQNDTAWHILGRLEPCPGEVSSTKRFLANLIMASCRRDRLIDGRAGHEKSDCAPILTGSITSPLELGRIYAQRERRRKRGDFITQRSSRCTTPKRTIRNKSAAGARRSQKCI